MTFFYSVFLLRVCILRISYPSLVGGPQLEAVCGTRQQTTNSALQL